MPLYDYQCGVCSHRFEELQRVDDPPLKDCPSCGKSALKKLVSAPAFTFKGDGWFKDLYGSSKPKGEGAGDKAADSGGGEAKPAKKEAASEKAAESKPKKAAASSASAD